MSHPSPCICAFVCRMDSWRLPSRFFPHDNSNGAYKMPTRGGQRGVSRSHLSLGLPRRNTASFSPQQGSLHLGVTLNRSSGIEMVSFVDSPARPNRGPAGRRWLHGGYANCPAQPTPGCLLAGDSKISKVSRRAARPEGFASKAPSIKFQSSVRMPWQGSSGPILFTPSPTVLSIPSTDWNVVLFEASNHIPCPLLKKSFCMRIRMHHRAHGNPPSGLRYPF